MEFLWSHGAVIQAGEIRHGPLEIVESGVLFLFLVPTDSSRVITQRALKFVEKWKGTAIVLDYADFAMGLHDDLAPFVMFVPLEWFCYYFSIALIVKVVVSKNLYFLFVQVIRYCSVPDVSINK